MVVVQNPFRDAPTIAGNTRFANFLANIFTLPDDGLTGDVFSDMTKSLLSINTFDAPANVDALLYCICPVEPPGFGNDMLLVVVIVKFELPSKEP